MLSSLQIVSKRGWRKKFKVIIEHVKRTARVGNYWYWLEAPELEGGMDIASLVCPLRYDVIVRRDFFPFYVAHQDLYISDFDAFVNLATQTSYYAWYKESEVIRCSPYLVGNDELLRVGFSDKIRGAVALYKSIMAYGFDQRFPIILRTAEHILPPTADRLAPPTGKFVSTRYFLADGCHRLALLMYMGYTLLPAGCFRVQCFREFSSFDSTSLLARSLPIEPSAYFAFLSSYYCAPLSFEHKDDFLKYIRESRPEFLKEVLAVIRVDGFGTDTSTRNNRGGIGAAESTEE